MSVFITHIAIGMAILYTLSAIVCVLAFYFDTEHNESYDEEEEEWLLFVRNERRSVEERVSWQKEGF